MLELEITNTGSFISEDKLANIFDSFYTFGKKSGTGLGLAISKKFVEAHGGKISCLSSEKMGQVSFYMSLPLAESPESAAISEQYTGAYFIVRKNQEDQGEQSKDRELEALCSEIKIKASKQEKKRILIADDEELYIEAVKGIFSSYGLEDYFNIDFETSSKRATEDLRYSNIDILICDIDFEGEDVDGIDLAKHLANINKNIKMAIHSNRNIQSVRNDLKGLECEFITKPISRKALLSFILSAMQVKPRVLVIEDSPLMAAMWRSKLANCYLDCIASADEVDVILTQTNICYDLIILDRYLDTSDSLESLYPKKLKAVFNCPIVLSSNAKLSGEESSDIDLEVGKEAISFVEIQNRLKENANV
jgi:CheY-like chemotaxis protein